MKKAIIVIAVAASSATFLFCAQQNAGQGGDEKMAMSLDLRHANFSEGLDLATHKITDKANLAQADYNN